MRSLTPEAYAVIEGRHSDPFRYLGPHVENDSSVVRVFLPDAEGVVVIDEHGHESDLQRIHDASLFEGRLSNGPRHYRLRARYGERQVEIEDPYRFPPILSEFDLYLLGEGTHMHLYEKLGAHPIVVDPDTIKRPHPAPADINALRAPISIYEVHLGSWRRHPPHGGRWLSSRELAEELPAYASDMGFPHVEFLPVCEHPFDGSWGY